MSKLSDLHAEGVTDLHAYNVGFEDGKRETEERIIKLLGIWDCNNDRCDCDSINECVYRQELIALIKGEK